MRSLRFLIVSLLLSLGIGFPVARAAEPFEIKEGDRVLLLGDTLLERENTYGYLETRMHEQFPDRHFTVRNLSWAGETPRGWSRASFDNPDKGWERLKEDIAKVRPTVVFLGFGMAASLQEMTDRSGDITLNPDPVRYGAEPMSAARFKRELGELMDAIVAQAAVPGRVGVPPAGSGVPPERTSQASGDVNPTATVPLPSEVREGGTPSPAGGTPTLPETAAAAPVRFVLLSPIRHEDLRAVRPGLPDPAPHNRLLEQYSKAIEELAKERTLTRSDEDRIRFVKLYGNMGDLRFKSPPAPEEERKAREADAKANVHFVPNGIHHSEAGNAQLAEDIGFTLGWRRGGPTPSPNTINPPLRAAVIAKNDLFFHQFRPANSTYLFGFRKHEQGQNAKEMPMYDPLIEAAEAEIDRLKRGGKTGQNETPEAALGAGKVDNYIRNANSRGQIARSDVRLDNSVSPIATPDARSANSVSPIATPDARPANSVSLKIAPDARSANSVSPTATPGTRSVDSGSPIAKADAAPAPSGSAMANSGTPPASAANSGPISGGLPPPLPDFTVENGYQIELWAQNPYLEKPTQMNWDPQGRLWVCSSSLYPMVEPGQAVDDKILILEDPDHTGKAMKSTVFADGLLIPTGVVPDLIPGRVGVPPAGSGVPPERSSRDAKTPQPQQVREGGTPSPGSPTHLPPLDPSAASAGGTPTLPETAAPGTPTLSPAACYVGQSTELLYFSDPTGTGKATEKRIVFSGFGTEDTHHIVHTLHWGPDGRLYFHQSVYIHTHLETPWGMVRLNSGGVFAYDPRTERVEVFIKGLWNTWGQAEDDWGQSFFTDGAGSTGLSWGFPGAIFAPFEGSRRQMASISPGSYPKFAGLEIVKSPAFPAEWQGNAITCDFRAHRIVRFAITDLAANANVSGRVGVPPAGSGVPPERSSRDTQTPPQVREGGTPSPAGGTPTLPEAKSGYTTVEQPDLVRTTDLSFRPIDVKLGPDGALYVADWSNPVINHGEVDFRDPRRDHHMGRIWRITKKDTPALKWEPLLGKKNEELLDKLLSKSAWEQQQARRVLANGNRDVMLVEVVQRPRTETDPAKSAALELEKRNLMVSFNMGRPTLADCKEEGFRIGAAMTRLVGRCAHLDNGIFANPLVSVIADQNPRVRLEAMRALARIPSARSAELVLDAAVGANVSGRVGVPPAGSGVSPERSSSDTKTPPQVREGGTPPPAGGTPTLPGTPENDPFYDFAAWLSINDLAQPWTDAIASGEYKTEGHEAQLAYGLKSIDPTLASATLARLFAAGKVPVDGSGPWIELIGDAGGPAELQRLLDGLLAGFVGDCCETDGTRAIDSKLAFTTEAAEGKSGGRPEGRAPLAERAVAALQTAAHVRNAKPAAHSELITALFHAPGEIGLGAIRLAGLWHAPDAVAKIGELLDSLETKPPLRRAAVDGLRAAGGDGALVLLDQLTRPEEQTDTRSAALVALTQVKPNVGVKKAAEVLPTLPDAALLGTWRGLLGVKGAPDAFATKFGKPDAVQAMPAPVIVAALRAAQELGRPGAKLLAALAPAGGAAAGAPSTDYTGLAAQTVQNGDPAKGELVYRRATSACTTCHSIGGAGGKVGPDMTSIGASAPLDYIIESILNPNAKVKEGFNAVSLTLLDGAQVTGIQARETASELILRDAAGTEKSVPKAMVKAKTDIGSMMPAGLTATMQPREAIDLYAFLSQLGKPGAYDASKGKVARVWRMYPGTAASEVVSATYDPAKNPGFPGYTLVDGRFVKDLLEPAVQIAAGGNASVFAVAEFQSTGPVHLKLVGATEAWLDDMQIQQRLPGPIAPIISPGVHRLAVKLNVDHLPEVLRAESDDVRFLGN